MRARPAAERGFTYLGLLAAIAILGLLLTIVGRVWQVTEQREREAQLLWIGHTYRLAIASYFTSGQGYPLKLQDLVQDDRFPEPKRHLRRLYPDPMTGKPDWTLIMTPDQSAIQGIASSSKSSPIKRDRFDTLDASFKDAKCYCDWKFEFIPRRWGGVTPVPGTGTPIVTPIGTPPAPPPRTQPPGVPTAAPGMPLPFTARPGGGPN